VTSALAALALSVGAQSAQAKYTVQLRCMTIFNIDFCGATGATGQSGSKGETGPTGPKICSRDCGPGATGAEGAKGAEGRRGAAGATGSTGSTGATGAGGTAGSTGSGGATGATGPTGLTGATGAAGVPGIPGAPGPPGPAGVTSPNPQGATGNTGPAGQNGATGAGGATGATGATGVTGATGPKGETGPTGRTIPGCACRQGETGATGPKGETGATGANGATGPRGVTGATGPTGATGAAGQTGATGATGAKGEPGATGGTGAAGKRGAAGGPGAAGAIGAEGAEGARGATGVTGARGTTGQSGETGNTGAGGTTGATGASGPAGATGTNGNTGATGETGGTGAEGADGASGGAGASGVTGATGGAGAKGETGNTGPTGAAGPGGFGGTLPPSRSEFGYWSVSTPEEPQIVPSFTLAAISFPAPLMGTLDETHVRYVSAAETAKNGSERSAITREACGEKGTLEHPTANLGYLCLYPGVETREDMTLHGITRPEPGATGTGPIGAWPTGASLAFEVIEVPLPGVIPFLEAQGTWAVTAPDPMLTSVSPTEAAPAAEVTLVGSNLKGARAVFFGNTAVTTGITVNSAGTELKVKVPEHAPEPVNVSVEVEGYISNSVSLRVRAPHPVLSAISPTEAAPGAEVTLVGSNLKGVRAVFFGNTAVTTGITVNMAGTGLKVKVPEHAPETVNVSVENAEFISNSVSLKIT
jgi:hypothetical protein